MNDLKWKICELSAWSTQRDQLKLRLEDLLAPHTGIWPEDLDSFFMHADKILESLNPLDKSLFLTCCTASWLLDKFSAPPGFDQWAAEKIKTIEVALPLPLDEARQWNWRRSCIVLSSSGQGRLVNVLYGVGNAKPGVYFPQWPQQLMDMEARKAVQTAWNMAELKEKSAAFWPMLDYIRPGGLIHGSSLGLPAYLTFISMTSPQPVFTMGATGKICKTRRILPVHGLKLKYKAARMARLSAFIHPDQEGARIIHKEPTEPVAVASLEEALAVWMHSVPGIANETALLVRSHNQGEFVRRLCRVPGSLMEWLENKNKTLSLALGSDKLTREDLQSLLNQMDELIKITPMPRDRIGPILQALSQDTVNIIMDKWPDLAYRLCNHQLRWTSSIGESSLSFLWENIAAQCADRALKTGLSVDDLFLEDVLRMVGRLHNRFIFDPKLPDDFISKLTTLEEYLVQIRKFQPGAALKILGKYYGTMIQNLGFCGPEYLTQLLEYTEKARDAFGDSEQERGELMRLENYLIFALLDAKRYDEAEDHLKIYMEITSLDQDMEYDNISDPFKHSALARFMADSGRIIQGYQDWIMRTWKKKPQVHPWQLWLYNAGRINIHDNPSLAGALLQHSLKICQNFGGPTVRALGLIPLSQLALLQPYEHLVNLKEQTTDILDIIQKSDLNHGHFSMVLEARDWSQALDIVRLNLHRIYPFSYR